MIGHYDHFQKIPQTLHLLRKNHLPMAGQTIIHLRCHDVNTVEIGYNEFQGPASFSRYNR